MHLGFLLVGATCYHRETSCNPTDVVLHGGFVSSMCSNSCFHPDDFELDSGSGIGGRGLSDGGVPLVTTELVCLLLATSYVVPRSGPVLTDARWVSWSSPRNLCFSVWMTPTLEPAFFSFFFVSWSLKNDLNLVSLRFLDASLIASAKLSFLVQSVSQSVSECACSSLRLSSRASTTGFILKRSNICDPFFSFCICCEHCLPGSDT